MIDLLQIWDQASIGQVLLKEKLISVINKWKILFFITGTRYLSNIVMVHIFRVALNLFCSKIKLYTLEEMIILEKSFQNYQISMACLMQRQLC